MNVTVINTNSYSSVENDSTRCHLMPCEIQYDGEAKATEYFEPSIRNKDTPAGSFMTSSYRGRPLLGDVVKVPEGYVGIVVKETNKVYTEEEDRDLNVTHRFKEFVHWNLDKEPSDDDKIKQALQWINLSKVLHRPLDTESSQKSLKMETKTDCNKSIQP
ncbi:hypothetical protein KUTeg_013278 [Tegillarca granosa]|uniref:Uncharacterized protein n=1 Tax=Tegillarca granosa TaxID=220873 RepID=A0ABQ9ET83_TEGGR|nr:hypothetical protein KUTeg_013278 [Tegillarca granosa]